MIDVKEIPELRGYTVEWAELDNYYLSRRNEIFRTNDLKPPFRPVAVIDASFWRRAAAHSRLAQRLLRFLVTNVIALENGDLFVTFDKTVGTVRARRYFPLKGLVRPCRVLRGGCAVDREGNVFFGEYLANEERREVRIYRHRTGSESLEVAYTFPAGSIRHIHGLYFDEYTDAIFCLAGDADNECRMIRSFDGFETIETVGEGDESWRAVSILFDKDNLYYGTDAEFRDNQIVKVSRSDLKRETVGEVNGTVFFSKRIGDELFFTTTAENAPSQTENVAAVWQIDASGTLEKLVSYEKDRWHKSLFMFGTIHFPSRNALQNELYFSLVGVNGDNKTFCIYKQV